MNQEEQNQETQEKHYTPEERQKYIDELQSSIDEKKNTEKELKKKVKRTVVRGNNTQKVPLAKRQFVCTTCGFIGSPKKIVKGSILIELVLWLAFLVPGLIYSIWRLTTKYDACPKCKNASMIPVDSPTGQKLIGENKQ